MQELFAAFGLNWKLLLIQAFNFGVLLVVLWKYLYTPVLKIIDERRGKIAESIQKAAAADQKLSDADAKGRGLVASAAREAEGLVTSARTRAESQAGDIARSAEARAKALLAEATSRADEVKRQAMIAGEKEIAQAAMLAAEKILQQKYS